MLLICWPGEYIYIQEVQTVCRIVHRLERENMPKIKGKLYFWNKNIAILSYLQCSKQTILSLEFSSTFKIYSILLLISMIEFIAYKNDGLSREVIEDRAVIV